MPSETVPKRSVASVARAASRQSVASWERDQRVQRFGHPTYIDYLSSGDWYRLKARYRKSDLPQDCQLCASTEEVDLHHCTYERVGEEKLTDLLPLCSPCHRLAHTLVRRGDLPDYGADSLRVLVDAERARRNQKVQGSLRAQQRREFEEMRAVDKARHRSRKLGVRVREVLVRAARLGTDVEGEVRRFEQAIEAIEIANDRSAEEVASPA